MATQKQTKLERYELRTRRIAADLPADHIYSLVIIEDVTLRSEKTIIKKLIHKYKRLVEEYNMFDIAAPIETKTLGILNSRLERLESF